MTFPEARTGDALVLRRSDWYVADATLADARLLVQKHHYAKGGSNTAVYVHGLYNKLTGGLFGVAWWLPPTRVACESVNKCNWTKVLSLTRFVLIPEAPKNAASFLLSKSVALIKSDGRFISLVTYADDSQGHVGTMYKAANWTYCGRTGPYPRWLDPKTGRQIACKSTKNRKVADMIALGYVKEGSFHKHKYVLHIRPRKRVIGGVFA